MEQTELGKNISCYARKSDIERIKRIKEKVNIPLIGIIRRGIESIEQESIENMTQNNIS